MQFITSALVLAPVAMAGSVNLLAARQSACTDTHIFLAKGNNEPYPGRQGQLVNDICDGLASCDYEDILYYNPVEAPYCGSVDQGVTDGIQQINAYNARCPNTKLVVSGYSQGSQIVSDILGGGGGVFFQNCVQQTSPALSVNSPAGKMIYAALTFGNTRHTANQPYNQFSGSSHDGIFPRPADQLAGLLPWTCKYHDYCVAEDPICAHGNVVADHLNYYDVYSETAAAWVKSMLAAPNCIGGDVVSSSSSAVVSSTTASSSAPFPTATGYSNTTSTATVNLSSASSILVIPTVTATASITVTVPCVTPNTAAMTAYTTFPAGTATGAGSSATATAKPSSPLNGTLPFTAGAASAAQSPVAVFGLVFAGVVAMLL